MRLGGKESVTRLMFAYDALFLIDETGSVQTVTTGVTKLLGEKIGVFGSGKPELLQCVEDVGQSSSAFGPV